MAYAMGGREREFGIRIVLGSGRLGILKLLFFRALRLVAIGMALGAVLTFGMRAWVASLLGANGMDALAVLASALLLCGVAALATFIPTRRASRIDPMQALRSE